MQKAYVHVIQIFRS